MSLVIVFFFILSANLVFASNETDYDMMDLSIENDGLSEITLNENSIALNESKVLSVTESPKTIEITQDTYENYFEIRTGEILDSADIHSGDTLKIGNITGRAFVIDRQLTLMPITSNDKITNGFIHLVEGSDRSTITNLTINNTRATLTIMGVTVGQLHGIWLTHSNNNTISYNTIRLANAAGVYAMPMGWSSYNRIVNNDMKTYITSNIVMGQCHYNLISHNRIEVLSVSDHSVTNLIYFNPFGHADYTDSALCKGNIISYNYLKGFSDSPMSIIMQLSYANHENTVVANNTVIKGSMGISLTGNNLSVYGNTVVNSSIAIGVAGSNFTIRNNTVNGESQTRGIVAECNSKNSLNNIFGNTITYTDIESAISISNNVNVYKNIINIRDYGIGVLIKNNYSTICQNTIKTNHDNGISIQGSCNNVSGNIINTNATGISITCDSNIRFYSNVLTDNRITSDHDGIVIRGLIYNTTITGNVIETNSSNPINIKITDKSSNTQLDNIINGVIVNATAVIINDQNFDQYFDEEGYLKDYSNNRLIFTFLKNRNIIFTDRITVIGNMMNNLLINVTVTFEGDAEGSIISDLNFMNRNRECIIINCVENITVNRNNMTIVVDNNCFSFSVIQLKDFCENSIIASNNIYINSNAEYTYGITTPASSTMKKRLSEGISISNNIIIMIAKGVGEAIYADALSNSEFSDNKINIISDGYGYGIAFSSANDKIGKLNITDNDINIHSKEMAYLIELYVIDNSRIENNMLYSKSSGIYGIGIYQCDNISIKNNHISAFGGNLKNIPFVTDTLGIGNSAIAIIKDTSHIAVHNNLINANSIPPISIVNVTYLKGINMNSNYYIIDDDNYNIYFDENGELNSSMIACNSTLILNHITGNRIMEINCPVRISSINTNPSEVSLILNKNASNSIISNIHLLNSTITINNASNIIIKDNVFNSSNSIILNVKNGANNVFTKNLINMNCSEINTILLTDSTQNIVSNNSFIIESSKAKIISSINSNGSSIANNTINAHGNKLTFIHSIDSKNDNIQNNVLRGNGSSVYGYMASHVNDGIVTGNDITIIGNSTLTNQAGIIYSNSSSNNTVSQNRIISNSANADDYAIMIVSMAGFGNLVVQNYLVSSNGSKRANDAVFAAYDYVDSNSPVEIYISADGNDITGNGSIENPYASVSRGLDNTLKHYTIYMGNGTYHESNLNISKNITLIAMNPGGVIIDAGSRQLFNISGILSINGIIIRNAHNVNGGSVFINNGKLNIYNSMFYNSSSYYDNSNPVFDRNITLNEYNDITSAHTYDCRNTGKGGVILNNGELTIDSSAFYDNFGHWGGVIANGGDMSITSSLFYNNRGVHGGVIYTDSKGNLTLENSLFDNNTAITTLDYCSLMKWLSSWSMASGNAYTYLHECGCDIGQGGVIYANTTSIFIINSSFTNNSARSGSVIFTPYDGSDSTLEIRGSIFTYNVARDTRSGNVSMSPDIYNINYNGGIIYGNYNGLDIDGCKFNNNQAKENGAVLYAKSNSGKILNSVIIDNTAGEGGGALYLSKNFIIMNCIISNNSAMRGGAIEYDSPSYYGHVRENLNIYNSTISGNKALYYGGAFSIGEGNITVHDSNIVGNTAPSSNTIHSYGGSYTTIDVRHNYWGITPQGREGPDNSVWTASKNLFRPWYKEWVHWEPERIENPAKPANSDLDNNNEPESSNTNNQKSSTGSNVHTGKTINGNGNKNNNNNAYPGDGNNIEPTGNGNGNSFGYLPGNRLYDGQSSHKNSNSNNFSEFRSNHEDVNLDSLSKTNSSRYDADLVSIGMTANAMSSSSDSKGDSNGGFESGSGETKVSKVFEISKKIEELLSDDKSMIIFIILAIMVLGLLIIGFRRKKREYEK